MTKYRRFRILIIGLLGFSIIYTFIFLTRFKFILPIIYQKQIFQYISVITIVNFAILVILLLSIYLDIKNSKKDKIKKEKNIKDYYRYRRFIIFLLDSSYSICYIYYKGNSVQAK